MSSRDPSDPGEHQHGCTLALPTMPAPPPLAPTPTPFRTRRQVAMAINDCPTARLVAVASRSYSKAVAFAKDVVGQLETGGVNSSHNYLELIADPNIDAVYVPLPTKLRAEWVETAAASGKHVLTEKPAAQDLATLKSMCEACAAHGVQFMVGEKGGRRGADRPAPLHPNPPQGRNNVSAPLAHEEDRGGPGPHW